MIPRLTARPPLYFAPKMSTIGRLHRMGKPSPAERLRQRRKARSDALRYVDKMQGRIVTRLHRMYIVGSLSMGTLPPFRAEDYDKHEAMIDMDDELPQSRGTTTGQLVAMHLTAEEEAERGGKWYGA